MSSSLVVTSAMDAPMSYSLGAMGPLLRKLDSLLPPDYRLPKLLKCRIDLLKADLEEISVALLEQSMVDSPNEMAKYWMNEVRALIYDIEDFIDNMMSTHADAKMRSVQSYKVGRVKIAWIPKTLKPCTRAAKVADLSTLVREASERYDRYLDGCTSSPKRVFTGHGRVSALYADAGKHLVGVDDSKTKLLNWLTDKEEQQLKVVAIVGPAGIGKTTLAKQVYHEIGEQFECRAFVRASRKPDMRRLLWGILSQVQQHERPSNFCTVQNLIDNLTEHLQNKRYLIVIDDLWETMAWDIVTSAFLEGNNRSRIITTTEIEVVALECCDYQSNNILNMKPLGGEDSEKLLTNLVFGPEHLCPEQFRVPSDIIITKCAGLPLATTFVAGLLTTQPNNVELWQHVEECLCSTLSTNSTFEETLREILKLSYNSLPHYLKTCLMYLSVYPEGYTLWKIHLVKDWMAEGFIRAAEGTDTAEVSDSYFEELVNRGMIQPVDTNYNGEVLSCTLHHIVLDLIALESTEERFITTLDYSETTRKHYSKARRLALHFSNTRYATKPTGLTMSNVRSIYFFGIIDCVPTVVGFKHLRILILEFWGDKRGSMTFNLTRICRLFQLRDLKILCDASVKVELPTQIRMLRYLETLIIDAAVSAVPLDIVELPGLLHLSLGVKADLPDKIGLLRSLRTLHCCDLGSNSEDNVLSLGDLMNLQDLHLTYCTEESNEHLKRNLTALASSLGKLVNLKSVTLAPGASGTAIYHDVWSSMSSFPVFIQRLEFLPPICIFSRLPKWIGQLHKLHTLEVVVSKLLTEDMDILIGLPALTILSLYVRRPTAENIIFGRGAFLGLKYFKYTCGVLSLAFQEGAFPNLQRLELSFNAHRGEQYDYLLLGLDYLLNVKEIAGTIGAATGAEEPDRRVAESAFKDAIRKHPRFSSYDNVKRVDWVCEEYQLTTQEKDSSSENSEILQKELRRKEGDSSDDQSRILLKEVGEDTELCADRISHFSATGSATPFDRMNTGFDINVLLKDARGRWLKPSEVYYILLNHEKLQISHNTPNKPPSGSLFLHNRRVNRFFRRDGYAWRRKKDGRTVGEAHERLKVGNIDALSCYYTHGEQNPCFQRRTFWMLEAAYDHIVLVQYLEVAEGKYYSSLSKGSAGSLSSLIYPSDTYGNHGSTSDFSEGSESRQSCLTEVSSYSVNKEYSHDSGILLSIPELEQSTLIGKPELSQIRLERSSKFCMTDNNDSANKSGLDQALKRITSELSLGDIYLNQAQPLNFVTNIEAAERQGNQTSDSPGEDKANQNVSNKRPYASIDAEAGAFPFPKKKGTQVGGGRGIPPPSWEDVLQSNSGLPESSIYQSGAHYQQSSEYQPPGGRDSSDLQMQLSTAKRFLSAHDGFQSYLNPDWRRTTPVTLQSDSYQSNLCPSEISESFLDHDKFETSSGEDKRLTLSPKQKFNIHEISPEWAFCSEITKVIITGDFLCDPSNSSWSVMFGDSEVPVEIVQPGVLRCHTPLHSSGRLTLCITTGNREVCSEVRDFEFRANSAVSSFTDLTPSFRSMKSAEELSLLAKFARILLSDDGSSAVLGGDPQSGQIPELKMNEEHWQQLIDELDVGCENSPSVVDWIMEELLKSKLQQWLSLKLHENDGTYCSLSKHDQGMIHLISALGYEWALYSVLSAGVGINWRDSNGWTALHWAAYFGREKMVAALLAAGASAPAVSDPTAQDPVGKTAAFLASERGHMGLAGYLSEVSLTSYLASLTIEESDVTKGSATVEAERAVDSISQRSAQLHGGTEDELSLKDSLAAVRNAAQAAARIQSVFRSFSFRKRQHKEARLKDEYGMTQEDIDELAAASRLCDKAAVSIQKKYKGWKGRKTFLNMRRNVVKMQAHVRGHQVRKKYKTFVSTVSVLEKVILRWRRKGHGLRGFRAEQSAMIEAEEGEEEYDDDFDDDEAVKIFRRQKVDGSVQEAVSRVLSVVDSPEARMQYRRMLEEVRQATAKWVHLMSNIIK